MDRVSQSARISAIVCCCCRLRDQVVADLDHDVRMSEGQGMFPQRMGDAVRWTVRFVAADVMAGRCCGQHRIGEPSVVIVKYADFDLPRATVPDGGEAVDRHEDRGRHRRQRARDRIVKRGVVFRQTSRPFDCRQCGVAGDVHTFAQGGHRIDGTGRTIAVIDQSRHRTCDKPGIQQIRHMRCHGHRAGVPDGVAVKVRGRQSKVVQARRDVSGGMFADQQHPSGAFHVMADDDVFGSGSSLDTHSCGSS